MEYSSEYPEWVNAAIDKLVVLDNIDKLNAVLVNLRVYDSL